MPTHYRNTLYLVRHGENPANITKEFSYKLVDYALTPKGVLQAEQTAAFLREVPLAAVYTSPLKRASETAEIIAHRHALPVTVLEEFREVNVGNLELRPPTEENWRLHDQITDQWFGGNPVAVFPGGENFLELLERTRRGLLKVTRGRQEQQLLIAAHGGILAALVYRFCPRDRALMKTIMDNCSITEIELLTSSNEILDGTLHRWASARHLSGEAAQLVSPLLEYKRS